jgi:hypothetical protein
METCTDVVYRLMAAFCEDSSKVSRVLKAR